MAKRKAEDVDHESDSDSAVASEEEEVQEKKKKAKKAAEKKPKETVKEPKVSCSGAVAVCVPLVHGVFIAEGHQDQEAETEGRGNGGCPGGCFGWNEWRQSARGRGWRKVYLAGEVAQGYCDQFQRYVYFDLSSACMADRVRLFPGKVYVSIREVRFLCHSPIVLMHNNRS